ncbi:zinc finger, C2H2 type [Ancylostoma duodenale]|uniref:Zinc finger, C2H2 type n=1 Tax=Ancylostoma duodenale TaxID=51022 RepID=A0A0C2GJ08_9BILA|nr:zinc finger, C2H2 type [Ancylostoma duodenale]
MADSEQKARRKLEEAEKKSRGGGGFLGKLFGGSGADEAADLFIQCDTEPSAGPARSRGDSFDEGDHLSSSDAEFSPVECDLCCREFSDIVAFESHYESAHSHQCTACTKMFISQKALEIHSDETHCPFHSIRVERDPNGCHFKCYDERCGDSFASTSERDRHCYQDHNINSVEVTIEKRKLAKRVGELGLSLDRLNVSKKKRAVPRSIKFGDQEKSFEGLRKRDITTRVRKHDS